MGDGNSSNCKQLATWTSSSADGQLLGNDRTTVGGRGRMAGDATSNETKLLPSIPVQQSSNMKSLQQGARRPCAVVNMQLPELDPSTRSIVATPTIDSNMQTRMRIEIRSPSPKMPSSSSSRDKKNSKKDADFVLDSPHVRRRKRSASVGMVVTSHFLSVPTDLRNATTPVSWSRSRSVECLGEVPNSVAFAPATLSFPIAADSLPPVQIRSPSLARRAAKHGKGLNSTDMENTGKLNFLQKQEIIASNSICRSQSTLDAQTVNDLRVTRDSDQLLSTEVSHLGRQCKKTGKS